MLQVLPGISVVPQQCDDAEQHRRRAKDDPSVQRRLHNGKSNAVVASGLSHKRGHFRSMFCSVSEKRGMHEFACFSIGGRPLSPDLLLPPPASIVSGIFT
jgi:hypothetical protein